MKTIPHTVIDEDAFFARYTPLVNPFNRDRGFDGHLLETYGEELEHVRHVAGTDPGRVWTLVESDGVMSIESGYHHVNRLGYLVTRHPFDPGTTVSVTLDDTTEGGAS
jgi:hypothetical protein